MGEPVIIDDGGSTRIKQLVNPQGNPPSDGIMDGLTNAGHSDLPKGSFSSLTIAFIGHNGQATTLGPFNLSSPPGTFEISSGNNQGVSGVVDGAGKCHLTAHGGGPPSVIKHSGTQPDYVVSNAGKIESVRVGNVERFNSTTTPAAAQMPVINTFVHIT